LRVRPLLADPLRPDPFQISNSSSGRGDASLRSTPRTISTIRWCVGAVQPPSFALPRFRPQPQHAEFGFNIGTRFARIDSVAESAGLL
jgi:hypothetical protein